MTVQRMCALAKVRRAPGSARERELHPRLRAVLAGAALLGVGLVGISYALGLYDRILHWGKLVHALEGRSNEADEADGYAAAAALAALAHGVEAVLGQPDGQRA